MDFAATSHLRFFGSPTTVVSFFALRAIGRIRGLVTDLLPMFLWSVVGAVAGFILNANAKEYVGVSDILKRYDMALTYGKLMVCDALFFCLLGPLLNPNGSSPGSAGEAAKV